MADLTSLKQAAEHFEKLLPDLAEADEVRIVGIGGPTAVGKSTLARLFVRAGAAQAVRVRVLEGDRWLVPQYRRPEVAIFPDDVYDLDGLRIALSALDAGRSFSAPFYERSGRTTGRISARGIRKPDSIPDEVVARCRDLQAKVGSRLRADIKTGDIYEEIEPQREVWVFDSELSLYDAALAEHLDVSYGIRGSRDLRMRHFLGAVAAGERYPRLTEEEAAAKMEGFFETDDRLIEPSVESADILVDLAKEEGEA